MNSFKLNRYDEGKNYLVTFTFIITCITLLMLFFAVCGYRYSFFSVGYSLLFLTKYAVYLSIFALALALVLALGKFKSTVELSDLSEMKN